MQSTKKQRLDDNSFSLFSYKFSKKIDLLIFIGFIFIGLLFFFVYKTSILVPKQSQIETTLAAEPTQTIGAPPTIATPEPKKPGLPVRLRIPAINVDAAVEYLGLTSDGSMDISKGPFEVAWYKLGPRPGGNGNAVIAGHYGEWKNGDKSVFDNLNKLQKGDKIYVEDENKIIFTFVVRDTKNYDPNADATNVFNSNDGKSHLNLITCQGTWSNTVKSYSQRLVIFSDIEI